MKTATSIIAVLALATQALCAPTIEKRSVVFDASTEPNGQGTRKSWVVDRWQCHNLAADGLDNQLSWAFVDAGLANGCTLYDIANCTGAYYSVMKNNGNILGPGAVNLSDVGFDKIASAFSCF